MAFFIAKDHRDIRHAARVGLPAADLDAAAGTRPRGRNGGRRDHHRHVAHGRRSLSTGGMAFGRTDATTAFSAKGRRHENNIAANLKSGSPRIFKKSISSDVLKAVDF
ncbi:hypothetical protein [Methylopila turkensis]|uniref:Uncharacterized protein n=1 Tax=Methylopila turkensis TaxID=1437816 RepID=A0A9W6JP04_9HYPH|nr:hypothetical protein [Methylopila turkensis]GLK79743.1 hypothetical protein GCM10008174_14840 [Methylopila turkensis]